jgi:hypothetical protein
MSEIYKKEKTEGKPTVFLVQENPYISVISAADYGEIVVLFESGQQIMFSPQPAIRKLKRKLKDFNDDDYLLMMGDPAAMGIACCVAAEMNRGKFNILKWDKKAQRYYPVSVNLNEKGEIDEQDKL